MKTKKFSRLLSLVIGLAMVFTMLPAMGVVAYAAEVGVASEQELKDAIASAKGGTVIKLTAEITLADGFDITNNASFTIDLNGQKLIFKNYVNKGIVYNGTGALTIIDSSAAKVGKIECINSWHECVIENRSTGTVNFVSGSMHSGSVTLISNTGTGTINIRGGSLNQETKCLLINHGTGIINISGGTLTTDYGYAIEDKTNGQINISAGTIEGSGESLIKSVGTGTVNISGGTVTGTGDRTIAVSMQHGKLTVSQANDKIPTLISSQSSFATLYDNNWEIPEKIIFDIQGGSIINTMDQGNVIAFDGRSNVNDKNIYTFINIAPEATIQGGIRPAPYLQPINTEQLLRTAVANAKDGSTIILTGNIDLTTGTLAIAQDINITLDLRGYRLGNTGAFDTITHSGAKTLTITDNSAAKTGSLNANNGGAENCALRNTGMGAINVKRGTVETTKSYPAIVNDGTGKIIIGGMAVVSSANTSTSNGGTIRINAVPESGDKLALDIQGGKVTNTASGGYSVYFAPATVIDDNIDDYLRIAANATVIGKRHPAPKPVFGVEYDVVGGTGSGSRLDRNFDTIATAPDSGVTAEDKANGNSVSLKLTVAETSAESTPDSEEVEGVRQGDSVQYYDVTVEKTVTTQEGTPTTTKLTSIPKPVRAIIPVPTAIQGKTSYTVYRVHNGVAEKIPNDPTAPEFYSLNSDGTSLTLHVKKFSTYAVITGEKALSGIGTLGDAANPINSAVDVQGKVLEGMFGIYKLDISWSAMKFDYNANGGVWDPDTHGYTPGGGTKGWTNESFDASNNKITVANHSNGDVTLGYQAVPNANLAGVTMTVRSTNSLAGVEAQDILLEKVPTETAAAPTVDTYVWLTGEPTDLAALNDKSYTKAGVITITAEADTASGLTPKNP